MRTPRSLFFMILCLWLGVVFDAYAAQGYRVGVGQTVTVNEWSVCKTVTNGAGADIFVPTNSSGEWSSFYSHLPGGVSTGSCVTPGAADYGTPGSYTFTVPAYNTLTVQIWGAGGGGVQGYSNCVGRLQGSLQTAGTGGSSAFGGYFASGGGTGARNTLGGPGTGGSGDIAGGAAYNWIGGNSPNGGAGGTQGKTGGWPGGGGGGGFSVCMFPQFMNYAGGGGGYSSRTYGAGALTPGQGIGLTVGAGGAGVGFGGAGGNGRVYISWN